MKLRKTYIEITTACNLACSFCGRTTRPPQFMDSGLFRQILGQIQGISQRVFFHVMGEPLLHPQLGEFLELCEPYKYDVYLVTNGRLLPDLADKLLDKPALRQISISLHSLPKNISPAEIDDFIGHVRSFAEHTQDQKLWIILRLWNKGSSDAKDLLLNRRILASLERVFELPAALAEDGAEKEMIKLSGNISLQFASRFCWPSMDAEALGDIGTCQGLRDQCAILVDGTVVPCCLDFEGQMPLGSLDESPLHDILAGPRAQQIRNGFIQHRIAEELCRRCSYRLRFNPDRTRVA